jgi:ABC-type uncharacterized transport system substrate-binding protein
MFLDGWMDGWMGGWVGVKAVLRIAYSNQKCKQTKTREKRLVHQQMFKPTGKDYFQLISQKAGLTFPTTNSVPSLTIHRIKVVLQEKVVRVIFTIKLRFIW